MKNFTERALCHLEASGVWHLNSPPRSRNMGIEAGGAGSWGGLEEGARIGVGWWMGSFMKRKFQESDEEEKINAFRCLSEMKGNLKWHDVMILTLVAIHFFFYFFHCS